MAIKKLQNNYTTPEQSKRLLELGVPADSADMYYCRMKHEDFELPKVIWESYSKSSATHPYVFIYLPCWSVGRLMAIYFISKGIDLWSPQLKKYQIENSAEYFVAIIANNIKDLDFSKLEE